MIAGKELRQRTRDRSAFVIAFLVPFGLAAIFSLTLAKVNEESKFTTTYGVADLDTLLSLARSANELTPWASDGTQYGLIFRPLLPDEHTC